MRAVITESDRVSVVERAPSTLTDFNQLLHALRTVELSRMPRAESVLLSAGCSDASFFDWVARAHGHVPQHWGVEFYRPTPESLPDNVRWIVASASHMPDVEDHSVDVLFSGQNFELLSVDFLLESRRVLVEGGRLVVDSPNRLITEPLAWRHPEHVIEASPAEARELLELAGFDINVCRGLWLCQEADGTMLPLMPDEGDVDELLRRSVCAGEAPDRSFIWWMEATSTARDVNPDTLAKSVGTLARELWDQRVNRGAYSPGIRTPDGIRIAEGTSGFVYLAGPIPLFRGDVHIEVVGSEVDSLTISVTDESGLEIARGESAEEFRVAETLFGCYVDLIASLPLRSQAFISTLSVRTSAVPLGS